MANDCFFDMKIKGIKRDCMIWLELMDKYYEENHFHKFSSVEVYYENGDENNYEMCLNGICAWSLESCCRASGYSDGVDLFSLNSKNLNIIMEVYSEEPECEFAEHYIYDCGECIVNEVRDYHEYRYDRNEFKNFEEFKKACGVPEEISYEDLDEHDIIKLGGFPDYSFSI